MPSNIKRGSDGTKNPVDIRGGPFGGVRPDKTPSSLAPTDFVRLENVRRIGGLVVSRPGQTAFSSFGGVVSGIYDFQSGTPGEISSGGGMFVTLGDGAGGLDNLNTYDPRQLPTIQLRQNYASMVAGVEMRTTRVYIEGVDNLPTVDCLVVAKNSTVDGIGATVCRLEAYDPGYSIDAEQIGGTSPITPLVSLPNVAGTTFTKIDSMVQYSDKLFICATSFDDLEWAVFSWDGQTINFETALTGAFGVACTTFRDMLVVFSDTDLVIRDQAGSWTTIPTGATALSTVNPNSVEVYKDRLYFLPSGLTGGGYAVGPPPPNQTCQLGSFDGTIVTISYPIGVQVQQVSRLLGLAVYNRYLYMTHSEGVEDPPDTALLYLSRFDGTTWEIPHHEFVAAPGFEFGDQVQAPVRAFHGSLYVGLVTEITKSPKKLTSGAWTAVQTTASMPQNMEIH